MLIELTLVIDTQPDNGWFIRKELEHLLDCPSEAGDCGNETFFEVLSRKNEMRGNAKLIKMKRPRQVIPTVL